MSTNEAQENTAAPSDGSSDREDRIRRRAYLLWEADSRPSGRDSEFWERACELEAIYASAGSGQLPATDSERVDEAALEANLGEFPDRLSDQGEHRAAPMTRSQARVAVKTG